MQSKIGYVHFTLKNHRFSLVSASDLSQGIWYNFSFATLLICVLIANEQAHRSLFRHGSDMSKESEKLATNFSVNAKTDRSVLCLLTDANASHSEYGWTQKTIPQRVTSIALDGIYYMNRTLRTFPKGAECGLK